MTSRKPSDALATLIDTLSPLDAQDRKRTFAAAQAYFGEASAVAPAAGGGEKVRQTDDQDDRLPLKARTWMKQNAVSMEEIEKVFHFGDSGVEIIAGSMPGKSKKEQTFNAYVLLGISKYLAVGVATFDDKEAREFCVSQGCYDAANHATNFKDKSNDFAGSKEKGWTITAPGLKTGAALVKALAEPAK